MKKYRIKKVNHSTLGPLYYPQKRVFLFFWENVLTFDAYFDGGYDTLEEAQKELCAYCKREEAQKELCAYCKRTVVEYIDFDPIEDCKK